MSDLHAFLAQISNIAVAKVTLLGREPADKTQCVFVGCGNWPDPAAPPTDGGLILNNKGTRKRFDRDYSSVTRLVSDPPDGLLKSWPLYGTRPLAPAAALQQLTLVVEDASADSVLGVLLLLGRLAGARITDIPDEWLDAVDLWEREGIAEDPWTSWCALESALAHRHFPSGLAVSDQALARSWTDGLRFLAACLARNVRPHAVPRLPEVPEWREASAALHQEERVYVDWLTYATVLQLSLPLHNTQDRRVLVDALLFVEDQLTGTAKVFYRNDRSRSPLKEGFAFAAQYRPTERGTGNDVTISVDPRRGVHLRELWQELERRETEAWARAGAKRRKDRIRDLAGVDSKHNEPWFITPDGTLIGAPRGHPQDGLGSRLSWADVRDAIWTVYNPWRDVTVVAPGSTGPTRLLELRPETAPARGPHPGSTGHDKCLLVAAWPRRPEDVAGAGPRSLSEAPLVPRVLAGMIQRGSRPDPLTLDELPSIASWDHVRLSGGFAVATQRGLFVLDDWTQTPLDLEPIRKAFHDAASLDRELDRLDSGELQPLVKDIAKLLTGAPDRPSPEHALPRAARIGTTLARLRGSHAAPPHDPDARAVWDALDGRWSLRRRLEALEAEVRSIEGSLRSVGELRTAAIGRFIAHTGFALLLAGAIADGLAKAIWWVRVHWLTGTSLPASLSWLHVCAYDWPHHADLCQIAAPEWLVFASFIVAAIVTSAAFRLLHADPLREKRK